VFLSDRIDWNAHPHLKRWFDLVKGRPGVVRGGARSSNLDRRSDATPNGCHLAAVW
jgi:hypothetical protein